MPHEHLVVIAFLAFLVVAGAAMALSVRRGRELCGELALRFPAEYEALGRPTPGYFDGPRRTAYMRFVMQSEYERLGDPHLTEQFDALRRSEMRQLRFVLCGLAGLGISVVWLRHFVV